MATTQEKMQSTWPDRLRALKVGDSLLIERDDLSPKQTNSLVRNFEHRQHQNVKYNIIVDEKGDSLVTCIFIKRGVSIERKPPGIHIKKAPAPKVADTIAEKAPDPRGTRVIRPPGDAPAVGFIEAIYSDGSRALFHILDAEHHGSTINKLMKEHNTMSVQSFAAGKTIRRKTTWEG